MCGISGDLDPSTRKSLAIAIVRFWCAKGGRLVLSFSSYPKNRLRQKIALKVILISEVKSIFEITFTLK